MISFVRLIQRLDQTNSSSHKVSLMASALASLPPADAAWTLFFLSGRRLSGLAKRAVIRQAILEESGFPEWLIDECREATGDSSEAYASLLPDRSQDLPSWSLEEAVTQVIQPLAVLGEEDQKEKLKSLWRVLDQPGRLTLNKMLTGAFRMGVSQDLAYRAAAQALGVEPGWIAQKLMGDWKPSAALWQNLAEAQDDQDKGRPYPFALAHPLPDLADLGSPADWLAEWKWDGIRAQVVTHSQGVCLWSRGEELLNESFPDVAAWAATLPPGLILDGEILAWQDGSPMEFSSLQRRLGRKNPSKKMQAEVPCLFLAFDLLAQAGEDWRPKPLSERRAALASLGIPVSEAVPFQTLDDLALLRARASEEGREGLMLKRLDAPYVGTRRTGIWWKWKVEPMAVDAVLVYAQTGSGKRASLYTDYTFALWKGEELMPFAKAYSGLSDAEIREVDRIIRQTTLEKHGPVRVVKPTQVFEIAFESIQLSSRHKSGVAVRFPRILRWRRDKTVDQADRLDSVLAMLEQRRSARNASQQDS